MNIYDMMKQLKSIQRSFEETKESLRSAKDMIEEDGIKIIFNGLGEIVDIEVQSQELKGNWEELKPKLIYLINLAQDRARDMAKEEFSRRFGGIFGGMGFGF